MLCRRRPGAACRRRAAAAARKRCMRSLRILGIPDEQGDDAVRSAGGALVMTMARPAHHADNRRDQHAVRFVDG